MSRRTLTSNFNTDPSAYSRLTHCVTPLNDYGVIRVTGKDAHSFLQGLLTNDMNVLNPHDPPKTSRPYHNVHGLYSAALTPKGRYLFDVLVSPDRESDPRMSPHESMPENQSYLLEAKLAMIPSLLQHLSKHRLRNKVTFDDLSNDFRVWSLMVGPSHYISLLNQLSYIETQADQSSTSGRKRTVLSAYIDPRCGMLGGRVIVPRTDIPWFVSDEFVPIGADFYEMLRILYGIPQSPNELIPEKTVILEANFQYLNGLSFKKGCYVGQELIARTNYRGQLRKRLYPAIIHRQSDLKDTQSSLQKSGAHPCQHIRHDTDLIFPQSIPLKSLTITKATDNDTDNADVSESLTESSTESSSKRGIPILNSRTGSKCGQLYSQSMNLAIIQLRDDALIHSEIDYILGDDMVADDNSDTLVVLPYLPPYMPPLESLIADYNSQTAVQ